MKTCPFCGCERIGYTEIRYVTYVSGKELGSMVVDVVDGPRCDNCHKRFDEDGNELCEHVFSKSICIHCGLKVWG